MSQQRVIPSAILSVTNLTGAVGDVQDDPDSPDASWLTANSDTADTQVRVSLPTPSTPPTIGAGLQNFRVQVRATGPGANPDARIEVWESGVLRLAGPDTPIGSLVGEVIALAWNASLLTDPTGAGVECRVVGTADGGLPIVDPDDTVEVGAIEWNVAYVSPSARGTTGTSGRSSGTATHMEPARGSNGETGRASGLKVSIATGDRGAVGSSGRASGVAEVLATSRSAIGSTGRAQGLKDAECSALAAGQVDGGALMGLPYPLHGEAEVSDGFVCASGATGTTGTSAGQADRFSFGRGATGSSGRASTLVFAVGTGKGTTGPAGRATGSSQRSSRGRGATGVGGRSGTTGNSRTGGPSRGATGPTARVAGVATRPIRRCEVAPATTRGCAVEPATTRRC